MKAKKNSVLIIGGSAGIGLEIARLFSSRGNKVIITGRNQQKLEAAALQLKNAETIVSDFSDAKDVEKLVSIIKKDHPDVNVLINNAAAANIYSVNGATENVFEKAGEEIHTNYLSVLRLTEKLLPVLKKHRNAAIVNVTSIVALVPGSLVGYSASKAALHSYTQSLRFQLEQHYPAIKVFELLPPLVNTEFSKSIGGEKGVSPKFVAEEFLEAFERDIYEVHVGFTKDLYKLSLEAPERAFEAMHPVQSRVLLN